MNILQIHNKYFFEGGEDQAVEEEKKMLLDKGHNVYQILRHNKKEIITVKDKIFTLLNLSHSQKTKDIINSELQKIPKIDIAHIHNIFPLWSYSVFEVLNENKIPIVMTLHNYRLIWSKFNLLNKNIKKFAFFKNSIFITFFISRLMNRKKVLLNLVNNFITLSKFAKETFIKAGISTNKISIKQNFLKKKNFNIKKIQDKNFVMYASRIEKLKGINFLLNTWNNNNIQLKIFGDGPLLYKLKKSNLNRNIDFYGHQPTEIIDSELNNSKFLIFPTEYYENMPITILQAFRSGTLVVASNIGSVKNIIKDGHNGILFNPEDSKSLQNKLNWISKNNEECNKIALNGFNDFIKNYTDELNYDLLINIYNNALNK
jgi:glycosyltransferase involved in cell wall biosynthesis